MEVLSSLIISSDFCLTFSCRMWLSRSVSGGKNSCECGRNIRIKIQNKYDKNTLTWCFPDCRLFLQLTAWPPGVWKLANVSKLKNLGRIIWSNSAKTVLVRRVLIQTIWDQQINRFQSWRPYFCRPMRIWEYVCPVKGSWIHLGGLQSLIPLWPYNFSLP